MFAILKKKKPSKFSQNDIIIVVLYIYNMRRQRSRINSVERRTFPIALEHQ